MQTIVSRVRQILMLTVILLTVMSVFQFYSRNQGRVMAISQNAPQPGDTIYRAQVEIKVCHIEDAGTDDSVAVSLNSENNTWLDYSRDDFERNSTFKYDLMLERARFIRDISNFRIYKTGSNGLALQRFTLFINGQPIYTKDFGSACHWLDNENGNRRDYTVSANTLRAHSLWKNYQQPAPPKLLKQDEIESRIEGTVGNALRAFKIPAHWGGTSGRAAVEVSRKGAQTLSVDLDLEADKLGDPDVDVDFDIKLGCMNGRMTIESTKPNISTMFDFLYKVDSVPPIKVDLNIGGSGCPTIRVNNNGDVELQYPTPTATPTRIPTKTPTPKPTATATASQTEQITFQQGRLPNAGYAGATDTTLVQDAILQNYGAVTECYVDGDDPPGSNLDMVALLSWDIRAIPANSRIKTAWITLYVTNRTDNTYSVYGLSRNWNEAQATWRRYQDGLDWAQPGAAGKPDRGDAPVGHIGPVDVGDRTLHLNNDGIALIQGWINGTIANTGLVIANPEAIDGLDFYCSEVSDSTLRPSLTIEYVR